jgi:hypothetical protein
MHDLGLSEFYRAATAGGHIRNGDNCVFGKIPQRLSSPAATEMYEHGTATAISGLREYNHGPYLRLLAFSYIKQQCQNFQLFPQHPFFPFFQPPTPPPPPHPP